MCGWSRRYSLIIAIAAAGACILARRLIKRRDKRIQDRRGDAEQAASARDIAASTESDSLNGVFPVMLVQLPGNVGLSDHVFSAHYMTVPLVVKDSNAGVALLVLQELCGSDMSDRKLFSEAFMMDAVRSAVCQFGLTAQSPTSVTGVDRLSAKLNVPLSPLFTHVVFSAEYTAFVGVLHGHGSLLCLIVATGDVPVASEDALTQFLTHGAGAVWGTVASSSCIKINRSFSRRSVGGCLRGIVRSATGVFLSVDYPDARHAQGVELRPQSLACPDASGHTLCFAEELNGDIVVHNLVAQVPETSPSNGASDVPIGVSAVASIVGTSSSFDSGRSPLLASSTAAILYEHNAVGVSFQVAQGSNVDVLAYADDPTVQYAVSNGRALSAWPVATLRRVCCLPQTWEQALCYDVADEYSELMSHNIIFHLTPWETRAERPRVNECDIAGRRAWMFQEDDSGRRCRTYVCPKVVTSDGKEKVSKGAPMPRGGEKVAVKEILLIRWETAIADWEDSLVMLRAFLDTLQITF